ncbi:MAG TPA: hypothetical protein PLB25_16140 [Rhodoferax sp.]|nr:hypothetical protein [Rhodoferax sp.]
MTFLLIWTFVGAQSLVAGHHQTAQYDWRQLASFSSGAACHQAARLLNISDNKHRCVNADGVLQ